jgi:hypothetical protein
MLVVFHLVRMNKVSGIFEFCRHFGLLFHVETQSSTVFPALIFHGVKRGIYGAQGPDGYSYGFPSNKRCRTPFPKIIVLEVMAF